MVLSFLYKKDIASPFPYCIFNRKSEKLCQIILYQLAETKIDSNNSLHTKQLNMILYFIILIL